MTGTAFERIECPYLSKAINCINPTVKLPNRSQIGDNLLSECFSDVKKTADQWLSTSNTIVTLTTDGWSNVLRNGIVNYLATNSKQCIYYREP